MALAVTIPKNQTTVTTQLLGTCVDHVATTTKQANGQTEEPTMAAHNATQSSARVGPERCLGTDTDTDADADADVDAECRCHRYETRPKLDAV